MIMKPRTRIQKEVVRLSDGLPKPTEKQMAYAFQYCFKHYAHRTKGGIITCTECGHRWKSEHPLAESVCGCTCPHCGKELEVLDSRKRVLRDNAYFSIITTRKGYQVIRYFMAKATFKVGQPADYSMCEVVQWWVAPSGKTEVIARLRSMHTMYYDLWTEWSDMELRGNKTLRAYDIDAYKTYPIIKVIPEVRRNGFKGRFYKLTPLELFSAILSDSRKETLLKAGQTEMLRYSVRTAKDLRDYWSAIKICIRNRYTIKDVSMWCDYIDLLRHFGKDTCNAKYVCPTDLNAEHDKWVAKKNAEQERQRREEQKRKALEDERKFKELKGRFFGICFTDGKILVRVLESVAEYLEEGCAMKHCVFTNGYYLKDNSLILSATMDGRRIETVEVSLDTLKVVQSRGVCNKQTEYHKRIIRLVNKNAGLIRQRMTA